MGNNNWKKITGAYLFGLGIGLLVTLGIGMLLAALIASQKMAESAMGYGAMAAVLLGSVVAAMVSAGKIGVRKLPSSMGSGLVFLAGLMLLGWLLFGRLQGGIGPTAALCLGGAALAGLMGQKGSGKSKYKVRKLRI